MIVPKFWAEGRLQQRQGGKQITVRRWGWSDESQAAAQSHADERAAAAMTRIAGGVTLPRREPKVAYNGAEGVPIREEIVATHHQTIITRNGYGALCLNTPNVLFADIDLAPADGSPSGATRTGLTALLLLSLGYVGESAALHYALIIGGICAVLIVLVKLLLPRKGDDYGDPRLRLDGGQKASAAGGAAPADDETTARARVDNFVAAHPDWHLRLYRTPAGFRLLAMHRTFDPNEQAATDFFQAIGTDPIFVKMCTRQQCFRARLTPKPWRIGVEKHYLPGVWPVESGRQTARNRWVKQYETAAQGYAACRFVAKLGSSRVAPEAEAVCRLHDEMCGAQSGKPLA